MKEQKAIYLSDSQREQIADILKRRAKDVSTFRYEVEKATSTKIDASPGSVQLALSREVHRLERLAEIIKPTVDDEEGDE